MNPNTPNAKRGYTLVELMLVMLLIALFGITILTLMQSGATAYQKIVENRNAESDARIALNYLDVRMRQNDQRGAVRLEPNPLGEGNALVIRETFDQVDYFTWIYFLDGTLYECQLLLPDEAVSVERSDPIANLLDFTFEMKGSAVYQSAEYTYATAQTDQVRSLSSIVTLRSGGQ